MSDVMISPFEIIHNKLAFQKGFSPTGHGSKNRVFHSCEVGHSAAKLQKNTSEEVRSTTNRAAAGVWGHMPQRERGPMAGSKYKATVRRGVSGAEPPRKF